MEAASVGGLVASAQNILSLCNNEFNAPPPVKHNRIYMSEMLMNWKAFGKGKFNRKYIKYEIGCRADDTTGLTGDRTVAHVRGWLNRLRAGSSYSRVSISTPADYVEKLLRVEPKHTNKPSWEYCDFAGTVHVLAAWLGSLSWTPSAKLSDLCDISKIRLVPVTNLEDSAALANNATFISQMVCGRPGSGAYWALVAATSAAGSTVATDRALLAGTEAPRFYCRSGHQLWRDILDALAVLAELYDRGNGGEIFSWAFFKGLHYMSSVVAHSDEGGLTRDVFRECHFPPPYGGLPPDSPMHSGLPTVADNAPYSSLCAITDSLCLASAAAVACCAPLVTLPNGSRRPVIIDSGMEFEDIANPVTPIKGSPPEAVAEHRKQVEKVLKARHEHVNRLTGPLLDAYFEFAEYYMPGLAKILGLAATGEREQACRSWVVQSLDLVLSDASNRHLIKNVALAPFYWVEPTTIFARGYFGTIADVEGWGSYGAGQQLLRERWLPGVEPVDRATAAWRYYEIDFEGARRSLWMSALAGHKDDGLAQIHFKRLDPEALALPGPKVSETGLVDAFSRRACLADYLWTRGQCSLPHPAEFVHYNSKVVIAVNHYKPAEDNWLAAVPSVNELKDAVLECRFTAPVGLKTGEANSEQRFFRVLRSRGLAALNNLVCRLQDSTEVAMSDGGYIMQAVPEVKVAVSRSARQPAVTTLPAKVEQEDKTEASSTTRKAAAAVQPGVSGKTHAAPLSPAIHAGSHVGPRLPTTGPGASGPLAADSDGVAPPVAGDGGLGARGAQGSPDGQGAAAKAPAPPC